MLVSNGGESAIAVLGLGALASGRKGRHERVEE